MLLVVASLLLCFVFTSGKIAQSVPIRGGEDIEINCPTLHYQFPAGTVRCEACLTIVRHLVKRAMDDRVDILDVGEMSCAEMDSTYELKQQKNGFRFWGRTADAEDRDVGVPDRYGPQRIMPLSFHSSEESAALPCSGFLLGRFCSSLLEKYEDTVFGQCFAKNGRVRSEVLRCLEDDLCQSVSHDCDAQMLSIARKRERELFLKYEGKFGNEKFPYVEDEAKPGLLMRNPYAPGGELAENNDLLHTHDL